MKKLLCAAVLLLAVGCVWEPFAMYDYKAIIEVTPCAAQTISTVVVEIDTSPAPPDTQYIDTTYTLDVTVYLQEMTGKKFRFEGAECRLYDSKGASLGTVGGSNIIPPKTNEEEDSVAVSMKLYITSTRAPGVGLINRLDAANEAEKWNAGTGFLGFTGFGNEIDHALSVDCLEGFAPITVTRGSWRITN